MYAIGTGLDHPVIRRGRAVVFGDMHEVALARPFANAICTAIPVRRESGRAIACPAVSKPSSPIDFAGLIEAIALGRDRDAFAALFDHFAPRIKTYMMRLGSAPGTAEDISQDTMLMVWRKSQTFDRTRAGAGAWIFAIARNQRIDALRRQGREATELDPSAEPDAPQQPDSALSAGQLELRVREALKLLPPEQARVIEMSFFLEVPHAAIAETLGLPLGTVKSRLRLAMKRLREILGDLS